MLTAKKPYEGVILIKGENQYEVAAAFMRLQEFYESPLTDIRDKFFTIEEYMDKYANEYGNFTYTSDWNGFNVPSDVVNKFFNEVFTENFLLEKEKKLRDLIYGSTDITKKFYVIGTHSEGAVLDHELSHAFFFLDEIYKAGAQEILSVFPQALIKKMHERLLEKGYCEEVLEDETFAYFATSSMVKLSKMLETDEVPWNHVFAAQKYAANAHKQKRVNHGH